MADTSGVTEFVLIHGCDVIRVLMDFDVILALLGNDVTLELSEEGVRLRGDVSILPLYHDVSDCDVMLVLTEFKAIVLLMQDVTLTQGSDARLAPGGDVTLALGSDVRLALIGYEVLFEYDITVGVFGNDVTVLLSSCNVLDIPVRASWTAIVCCACEGDRLSSAPSLGPTFQIVFDEIGGEFPVHAVSPVGWGFGDNGRRWPEIGLAGCNSGD